MLFSINRTKVELKPQRALYFGDERHAINRTKVELKHG